METATDLPIKSLENGFPNGLNQSTQMFLQLSKFQQEKQFKKEKFDQALDMLNPLLFQSRKLKIVKAFETAGFVNMKHEFLLIVNDDKKLMSLMKTFANKFLCARYKSSRMAHCLHCDRPYENHFNELETDDVILMETINTILPFIAEMYDEYKKEFIKVKQENDIDREFFEEKVNCVKELRKLGFKKCNSPFFLEIITQCTNRLKIISELKRCMNNLLCLENGYPCDKNFAFAKQLSQLLPELGELYTVLYNKIQSHYTNEYEYESSDEYIISENEFREYMEVAF